MLGQKLRNACQKLRLQRGRSQEDFPIWAPSVFAPSGGVERGHAVGTEAIKALAAVFEVCFLSLRESDTRQPSALSVDRDAAVALAPPARDQAL